MMDPDDRPFGSMRDHARSVRQSGYFVGHADVAQTVTEPVVEPLGVGPRVEAHRPDAQLWSIDRDEVKRPPAADDPVVESRWACGLASAAGLPGGPSRGDMPSRDVASQPAPPGLQPAPGRLRVAASGGARSVDGCGVVPWPEMAVRDRQVLPGRASGHRDEIGRDAEDPLDAAGIRPAVVLDETHPLIWRNDRGLGIFELVPGERHLEEFQKRILVTLYPRQPGVVPLRCWVAHARGSTPGVADRGFEVNLIEGRDEGNCLGRLDSWHGVLHMGGVGNSSAALPRT
jgi:hypothetical protein